MASPTVNEPIVKRLKVGSGIVIGLKSSRAAIPQLRGQGHWLYVVNQSVPMPDRLAELGRNKRKNLIRCLTTLVGFPFDGFNYLWLSQWPGMWMEHRVLAVRMPLSEAL